MNLDVSCMKAAKTRRSTRAFPWNDFRKSLGEAEPANKKSEHRIVMLHNRGNEIKLVNFIWAEKSSDFFCLQFFIVQKQNRFGEKICTFQVCWIKCGCCLVTLWEFYDCQSEIEINWEEAITIEGFIKKLENHQHVFEKLLHDGEDVPISQHWLTVKKPFDN